MEHGNPIRVVVLCDVTELTRTGDVNSPRGAMWKLGGKVS
jgi:hypothetical protein